MVAALPAYSCYDLVTAAVGAGIGVRFYDVDPTTLTPDLDSVRQVLEEGVSLLVAGNLFGYPLPWEALSTLCADAGVPVIEDAAQGLGSVAAGQIGGALGHATVLSFGRGKGWTGGGGGALLIRDGRFTVDEKLLGGEEILGGSPSAWGVANAATSAVAWALGRPSLYGLPTSLPGLALGETRYREPSSIQGMPRFSAALVRRTSADAELAVGGRQETARRLEDTLRTSGASPATVEPCQPLGGPDRAGYLRLPALARSRDTAEALARAGAALGIARAYPEPLHRLPPAEPLFVGDPADLPGSEALARRLVTFPTHRWVGEREVAALARVAADAG